MLKYGFLPFVSLEDLWLWAHVQCCGWSPPTPTPPSVKGPLCSSSPHSASVPLAPDSCDECSCNECCCHDIVLLSFLFVSEI